jgi:hypothetical protein
MLGKRASPVRREAVRKGPFRYLAGGPPYRTAGSARGPGKRTGSNPGTALQADSANPRSHCETADPEVLVSAPRAGYLESVAERTELDSGW